MIRTYAYFLNDSRLCYYGNQLEDYDTFCLKDCTVLKIFMQHTPRGKNEKKVRKRGACNEKTFKFKIKKFTKSVSINESAVETSSAKT